MTQPTSTLAATRHRWRWIRRTAMVVSALSLLVASLFVDLNGCLPWLGEMESLLVAGTLGGVGVVSSLFVLLFDPGWRLIAILTIGESFFLVICPLVADWGQVIWR